MPIGKNIAVCVSRQRWISYNLRRSLVKRLWPQLLKDFAFEVPLFDPSWGMRFQGNTANYVDRWIYFAGAYEKHVLNLLRRYVTSIGSAHLTFMDVGANVGNHSLYMSKLVERVLAFEPFDRARARLEHHLSLNGIQNVTVYPFGLSKARERKPLYAGPDSNLGAASVCPDHQAGNYLSGEIDLRVGDDTVQEVGGTVDIIKVDVEGYERFVLEGLKATIRRDRPLIVVELSRSTKATIAGHADFVDLFSDRYVFLRIASYSLDRGTCRLAPFVYTPSPSSDDVIACPAERLPFLPTS